MASDCTGDFSLENDSGFLCHCFQLTREAVLEAIVSRDIQTLKDLQRCTGAGDACRACLRRLEEFLRTRSYPSSSSDPICSAR